MLTKNELNLLRREYREELFGRLLKKWREDSGLTQQKFAEFLEWPTSQYVANIENGNASFPAEKIRLICKIVNNVCPEEIINCLLRIEEKVLKSRVYGKKI